MWRVLLVQTPDAPWESAQRVLANGPCQVQVANDVYEALETIESIDPQIVLLDITRPGLDGPEIVRHLQELQPDVKVIVAADPGDLSSAVQALEMGASDFVLKPVNETAIRVALARAQDRIRLRGKLQKAVKEIRQRHQFERELIVTSMDGIIANDPDGNIIVFNEGASRIYGYKPEEAVGKIHVSALYPEGEARRVKKEIYGPNHGGPGRLINYHTLALTKSGQLTPIVLSASLIFEKGTEAATVGYFKDLSEIMRDLDQDRFPTAAPISALIQELLSSAKNLQAAARQFKADLGESDLSRFQTHCRNLQGRLDHLVEMLEVANKKGSNRLKEKSLTG